MKCETVNCGVVFRKGRWHARPPVPFGEVAWRRLRDTDRLVLVAVQPALGPAEEVDDGTE